MGREEEVVPGLADAIERRRIECGLSPGSFAEAAGVTPQGLAPLRKGYLRNYQDKLKIGVCRALGWTGNSIDLLLQGLPPARATDYSALDALYATHPTTIADVEGLREQLRLEILDLSNQINEIRRSLGTERIDTVDT